MSEDTLALKYRPKTLDRILGHEQAVTRIKGMISSGKIPGAIAFFGPPSAGKTTLARCIAAEINGKPISQQQDYKEVNAADERGIDDVRELVRLSKFRPQNKKRIIVIDEAHQLVSNNPAAQTFLKPLEEPSKDTLWIICSMEPAKFQGTTVGKAILSRCTVFNLEEHSGPDLLKQAVRIAKGEKMDYVVTEDKAVLKAVVKNCGNQMRTLANLMQGLQQHYEGLDTKPKRLKIEDVSTVLDSSQSSDDKLAAELMIALYSLQFKKVQRCLLDVTEPFQFVKKLAWIASFMLNVAVVEGRHPKVWWTPVNKEVHGATKELKLTLGTLAAVNAQIVKTQAQSLSFQIPATELLSSDLYYLIKSLSAATK